MPHHGLARLAHGFDNYLCVYVCAVPLEATSTECASAAAPQQPLTTTGVRPPDAPAPPHPASGRARHLPAPEATGHARLSHHMHRVCRHTRLKPQPAPPTHTHRCAPSGLPRSTAPGRLPGRARRLTAPEATGHVPPPSPHAPCVPPHTEASTTGPTRAPTPLSRPRLAPPSTQTLVWCNGAHKGAQEAPPASRHRLPGPRARLTTCPWSWASLRRAFPPSLRLHRPRACSPRAHAPRALPLSWSKQHTAAGARVRRRKYEDALVAPA